MNDDTQTDIFGDPQTEPDISSEALDWEPDAPTIETGNDASLQSGEEEDESDEGDKPGGDDGGEDAGGGDEPGDDDDDFEVPEHLAALKDKSPEELLRIAVDAQQMVSKQSNEIGDLRKMVEQVASLQLQQAQAQYQQQSAADTIPASEYIETEQDGLIAYREAIDLLGRGEIGPDAIDDIIDVMRDIAPHTAAKMDRDFGMRLARAEMNVQMAPVIEQSYTAALKQATATVNADPDAEAYREDIVRIVQEPKTLAEQQVAAAYRQSRTAGDLTVVLQEALKLARGADPVRSTAYRQALAKAKRDEAVEPGNASPPPTPVSEMDAIRNSLLKPKDPGADLFAGFGGG